MTESQAASSSRRLLVEERRRLIVDFEEQGVPRWKSFRRNSAHRSVTIRNDLEMLARSAAIARLQAARCQ